MAFMMPVVKNDWDIYKSNRTQRQRRVSEGSAPVTNQRSTRSRKVSECKSEGPSLSTSPGSDFYSPGHRSVPSNMSKHYCTYSRASSRTSEASLQSPNKSATSSSPPKSASSSSLNKFHNRLLDKLKRSLRINNADNEKTSS